ncbi:MAG: helix-turn-helix transcriptional regulator [Planctomycetia bacterium]|jgi:predicted DNA-binding transcriptional regulator YafY
MPRNLSRHEQFLRIFALLEILSTARKPLDDQSLLLALRERLGLSRLSARTLHRDCDFLVTCGYAISHEPLPGDRKYGWQLSQPPGGGKKIPAEPVTVLELVAFMVGRDLLRTLEGTVLWSGIESLRHKIEAALPAELLQRLESARRVFHVIGFETARYAARPRLISALSAAITDCREIQIVERAAAEAPAKPLRLRPLRLVIHPPRVQLVAMPADETAVAEPILLDIERIDSVQPLDASFTQPDIDLEALVERFQQPG